MLSARLRGLLVVLIDRVAMTALSVYLRYYFKDYYEVIYLSLLLILAGSICLDS